MLGKAAEGLGLRIYDVSYVAGLCVMLGVFVFTASAIVEPPRPMNASALRRGFANVPTVVRDAILLALKHRTLSILLAALALFLMTTNPVEVIWPTYAKPMLDERYANTDIGVVTAIYFFSIALGAALSPHISRIFRRRQAATLAAAFACLTGVQIALALQGGIIGLVTVFVLYSVILGISETPASSILHRCVGDHQRSTMLSLRSLIQQLGAALGLVLAGAVAEFYTTPVAWIVGAAFLFIAVILILVLVKRLAKDAEI
ncbi:MAG: MFS transporter [Ruegeria sp.]